jgi:hypothetical protein
MTPSSKQLKGIETRANAGAIIHSIEYFVLDKDLATYVPSIGDIAKWAPGKSAVTSYNKAYYGPGCWLLYITAEELDSDLIYHPESLADEISKSYSISELYFPRQWWNIRLASAQEAGYADDGAGAQARTESNAFLDIFGNKADTGSMLFHSATKTSKGTPSYALCPFLSPSATTMPVSLVEQRIKTKVYSLTYYTTRPINNIYNFVGVSGPFTGECRPVPTGPGKWRADHQTLDTVRDPKGKTWVKVFRKMTMAPEGLVWDPAKNGGTWSW